MFTRKNLFTALILTSAALSTSAMANGDIAGLQSQTDYLVASAIEEVRQETSINIAYDVITASHTFEPDANKATTLLADITITPISPETTDDNDA